MTTYSWYYYVIMQLAHLLKSKIHLHSSQRSTRAITIAFFVLLVVGIFYSINLLIIGVGITAVYFVLRRLPVPLFGSRLASILGALFLYTTLLAAVSSIADIFYNDFTISFGPLLVLLLLGASAALYHFFPSKQKTTTSLLRHTVDRIDIFSLLIAGTVMGLIVILPFMKYGLEGGILGQVNANVDDSVHVAMINDRLHFQQDFYLDNSPETVRAEDKISYPAMWHTVNAVLIDAVAPHIDTGVQTLIAYVLSKTFWAIIFIYFLARAVLLRLEDVSKSSVSFYFGLGLLLFFSYIAAVSQFLFGFYNFIPQLIALLILSSLVFAKTSLTQKRDLLLIGSIIVIGGGMVWFLLLPVMAATLITLLFCSFEKNALRSTLATITQSLRTYPLVYSALLAAILQQIYIATFSSESLSFIESIILAGEVARYSQLIFVMLAIGVIAYLFLRDKKDSDINAASWTTAFLMIFAAFILAICLIKTGEPRYYYYKVLSAVVIVLIPFCIAGLVRMFRLLETRLDHRTQWPVAIVILAMVVISVLPAFSSTGNILSYMKGERPTTSSSIDSVFKNLQNESSYADPSVSYKMYFDHRSFPQNFINTMLVKANQPDSPCFRETLGVLINEHSAVGMANTAAKLCTTQKLSIVVPAREYPIIKKLLDEQHTPAHVNLMTE